jgi:hypothetical protein
MYLAVPTSRAGKSSPEEPAEEELDSAPPVKSKKK